MDASIHYPHEFLFLRLELEHVRPAGRLALYNDGLSGLLRLSLSGRPPPPPLPSLPPVSNPVLGLS